MMRRRLRPEHRIPDGFPHRLLEARQAKNLTQKEAAKLVGWSTGRIGMYETGLRMPSPRDAEKLADALGVQVAELLWGVAGPNSLPSGHKRAPLLQWEEVSRFVKAISSTRKQKFQAKDHTVIESDRDNIYYTLEVQDESMVAVFPDRCKIVVDPTREPKSQQFVVARPADSKLPALRRYVLVGPGQAAALAPLDDKYAKPTAVGEILGTVVQVIPKTVDLV